MDQEADRDSAILDLPTELPGLLCHPHTRRARCAACQMDAPAAHLDEEQTIQRLQPGSFDGEEITGNDLVLGVRQKCAPRAPVLAALRCGWDMLALEHVADRRASDVTAQFAEFALQLAIAPRRVLLRQ